MQYAFDNVTGYSVPPALRSRPLRPGRCQRGVVPRCAFARALRVRRATLRAVLVSARGALDTPAGRRRLRQLVLLPSPPPRPARATSNRSRCRRSGGRFLPLCRTPFEGCCSGTLRSSPRRTSVSRRNNRIKKRK